ncbi:hypothetical protein BDBG_00519 [Blastomyces gilchristii SLH14081]|uniref:Uncharacterized protein n=1 Tax=Blastomyces gilchristii (strain SLH14081) TaxID=559298 RepID=A0A179U738_BLAGS|nr:uncharacterized protein BDBG_00519 [Blastomyces gilchristii SLH14081]OAT03845.1 hypothetical protein BDBG_00519 [Blastomyces gilchristii SLH14081]
MSSTPDTVAKKRGRPKKAVAAATKTSTATSESTTTTTSTGTSTTKKSTPSTTRTTRKSSPKANSPPASDPKPASSAPIDRKPAAKKKSAPTRQKKSSVTAPDPAQGLPKPPSAPSQIPGNNSRAKSDQVGVKSRLRTSASNPAAEQPPAPRTPSAESKSISHSETTELAGKQEATGRRQPEARNSVQAAGEISEPPAQSARGRERTIEPKRVAEQTPPPPAHPVDATVATVQGSKILTALAASSSKPTRKATFIEDKIKKASAPRPIESSGQAITTDMATLASKKASPSGPRQPPPHPPAIRPQLAQAASARRETQRVKPQRPEPAPGVKPQDIRNTKQYKSLARRWTSAVVALPILLYTSYALYERVFADKAPRSLPGTNNFPLVDNSAQSTSQPSTSTNKDNYNG